MKKAFSLIELSIVILIIGILVAGVTQSSRLINQFKIQTAQKMTESSPVSSIKDLILWYETSLEKSIAEAEAVDATEVATWNDINPQRSAKLNATQGTTGLKPLYTERLINGLAGLRFDGTDDFLAFDGTGLGGRDITVFAVGQRRSGGAFNYLVSGEGSVNGTILNFGFRNSTAIWLQDNGVTNIAYTIPAYSSPIPTIMGGVMSATQGRKMWVNSLSPVTVDAAQTTVLINYPLARIGRFSTANYAAVDVCEIIIFDRALKSSEVSDIMTYLGKKYNIKVS